MTDKDIVIRQLSHIHSLERRSSIKKVKSHSTEMIDGNTVVGNKMYIKKESYFDDLNNIKNDDKNFILLSDNSIISYCYHFDRMGNVVKHSLYYIPDMLDDASFWTARSSSNPDAYNEYFNNTISKYLRIDFDQLGQEEYSHALVHMHIGLRDNEFRFPFYGVLYPNEFIYLVLKFIYKDDDNQLSIIADFDINNRITKLTPSEQTKFFASIGIFHV